MDVGNHYIVLKKIKIYLVFFYVGIFSSCQNIEETTATSVNFQDGKAISVSFFHSGNSEDFEVHLAEDSDTPILGVFMAEKSKCTFIPVVPFTNHQEYQILFKDDIIAEFSVKPNQISTAPEVLAIYPSRDTVPVNLLKMYFVFSQPMQKVGNPLDFISVFDETENKEVHPFLELENELWNKDQTRLTLWLDPGRIKTDLIPNTEKGLPLKQNHSYKVSIDKSWKSSQGISLSRSYHKNFYVTPPDTQKPTPKEWIVTVPKKGTGNPLKIDFREPMDAILALESITIYNGRKIVKGIFNLTKKNDAIQFNPDTPWTAGEYSIIVNPILEDLAGNNLNHLFDTDLDKNMNGKGLIVKELGFTIQ